MKKLIIPFILTYLATAQLAFGAGVEQKFPTDSLTFGVGASATSKILTVNTNDGALNPKLTIPMATKDFNFNKAVKIAANLLRVGDGANVITKVIEFDLGLGASNPKMNFNSVSGEYEFENGTINAKGNLISLGDGTNTNKTIKFNKGASSPEIRYNSATSKIEFSNDAVVYKAIGSGAGGGVGINLLDNKGFEDGISVGWTNSGGTYAAAIAPNILFENVSVAFTASGAGQYFESNAVAVPKILFGEKCYAKLQYSGGDANAYLTVMDGASVEIITTAARALLNATAGTKTVKTYFDCPSSGSIKFRVVSTAAMAVAYFDEGALGTADFQPLKQSTSVGQLKYLGVASCSWQTTSTTFVNYAANASCGTPVVRGQLQATPTKVPGFVLPIAPKGVYRITAAGTFGKFGAADGETSWRFSDGTNFSGNNNNRNNTSFQSVPNITGTIELLSDQTNWTVQIQALTTNASNSATIENVTPTSQQLTFDVEYFPSGTDTVVNSKCLNDIACENTFSAKVSNAGIVSDENLDWINGNCSGAAPYICGFNASIFTVAPNCSITLGSTGGTETRINALSASSITVASFNSAGGTANTDFHLVCRKTGGDFKAKQNIQGFLSSTVTSTSNNIRTEHVKFSGATFNTPCTSTPCTIQNQSGGFTSITRTATGQYTGNIAAGVFSAPPTCTYSGANNTTAVIVSSATNSATSVAMGTYTSNTAALTDAYVDIICHGPR